MPASSERGALGWCTVSLIYHEGKKILFDTGSYGDRIFLLQGLRKLGLNTDQIDIVFVSHLHFDHFLNAEIFTASTIMVPRRDMRYVLENEYIARGDPYVPVSTVKYLRDRLMMVEDGEEILEGMKVVSLPGHTPGSAGLFCEDGRILFAGDAVKNGWEFVNNKAPQVFYSKEAALKNYEYVKRSVQVIVPGHDRPFNLKKDYSIEYMSDYTAVITICSDPRQEKRLIELR